MNSFEIEKLLERDMRFLGCFPHDKLPSFPKQFPRSLIINTDDSTRLGDHWVGVILNKDKCFYFDSYGVPILDKNIIDFLITKEEPDDLDFINLARLINRYSNFPGEIEIKNDIEKILNFWKITKNELFSKTKNIWSNSFRPSNTDKDLVGSGFDTSN